MLLYKCSCLPVYSISYPSALMKGFQFLLQMIHFPLLPHYFTSLELSFFIFPALKSHFLPFLFFLLFLILVFLLGNPLLPFKYFSKKWGEIKKLVMSVLESSTICDKTLLLTNQKQILWCDSLVADRALL